MQSISEADQKQNKNRYLLVGVVLTLAFVGVIALIAVPACKVYMMMTGTYDIDTVRFDLTDSATATTGADGSTEPGIWINTNIEFDLWNRSIKSSKPYSIAIDKTDASFTYASVVFTKVKITYDDGSVEPIKLSLPLIIDATEYTSTNSDSSGNVVKTKIRLISGMIPGVITRDDPFALELEGYFQLDDGSQAPFTIDQHYDVVIEQTTKPAADVMQDI